MIHAFWHGFGNGLGWAAAGFVIRSLGVLTILAAVFFTIRALVRRVGRIFHRGQR